MMTCENYGGWPIPYLSILGPKFLFDSDAIDVDRGELKDNSNVCLGTDAALSNFYVRSCFAQRVSNVMTLACFFQVICIFFYTFEDVLVSMFQLF